MNRTHWNSLWLLLCLMACGESVVDSSYRGVPLFEFEGQLDVQGRFEPGFHNIRLSIFWLPDGPDTARDAWIEQASTSIIVDFPSSFSVKIYEPPQEKHFFRDEALGRLILYDDLNQDGRLSKDEPIVGDAPNQGIIYSPEGVERRSFTAVEFPVGFSLAHYPFRCRTRNDRQRDAYCVANLGEACTDHTDCCQPSGNCERVGGLCLPENEGLQRFPGGYCAARANSTACNRAARETEERPGRVQARPLPINLMGRIATVFLKRCKSTADCRAEYVCEAAYEVCLPDRPVQLAMNAQYEPASICVEDYEKEP